MNLKDIQVFDKEDFFLKKQLIITFDDGSQLETTINIGCPAKQVAQDIDYLAKGISIKADKRPVVDSQHMGSFDTFWSKYPRKTNRPQAQKAFNKLKPNHDLLTMILNNIDQLISSGQWKDKQFIPHASTYLNNQRWNDEIIGSSNEASGPVNQQDEVERQLSDPNYALQNFY